MEKLGDCGEPIDELQGLRLLVQLVQLVRLVQLEKPERRVQHYSQPELRQLQSSPWPLQQPSS